MSRSGHLAPGQPLINCSYGAMSRRPALLEMWVSGHFFWALINCFLAQCQNAQPGLKCKDLAIWLSGLGQPLINCSYGAMSKRTAWLDMYRCKNSNPCLKCRSFVSPLYLESRIFQNLGPFVWSNKKATGLAMTSRVSNRACNDFQSWGVYRLQPPS